MNFFDSMKNSALNAGGRVKEATGAIIGNPDMKARGQADQMTANLRQAGNRVKGAAESVASAFKG